MFFNSLPDHLPKKLVMAHIAFFITTVIWAAAGPIIKLLLVHLPPYTVLFLRFLTVCTILLPYLIIELKKNPVRPKDYLNFLLLGLFSQTALILVFVGLNYTSVLDYTIINVLGLVGAVYAGHYFYKEKVNPRLTIGLILATLGVFVVVLEPFLQERGLNLGSEKRILGNALALIYNVTWVIYVVWSKMSMGESSKLLKKTLSFVHLKPMTKSYSPFVIVAVSFYVGLLSLTPLFVYENLHGANTNFVNIIQENPITIFEILYMALLSSLAAYVLYQWALENAKVTDTAMYGYLGTVMTFPFVYLLLGEIPNTFMIAGGALIAAGVVIAESKNT